MRYVKLIAAFVASVAAATILAVVFQTQFVLGELIALGVAIPLGVRLETTLFDLAGMGPTYGGLIGVGFLIAFPVATLVSRALPIPKPVLFILAGAATMATILALFDLMLGSMPISGARGDAGMAVQALAGAVGGFVFSRWRPGRTAPR